jgi:mono/diheme cytochrome c family protein
MIRPSILFPSIVSLLVSCAPAEPACVGTNDVTDTGSDTDTSEPQDTAPPPTGEELYTDFCASCHGADARGGSERGIDRDVQNMPDADLVRIILNGAGEMAPVPVSEDEAYAIVAYIRTIVP